MLARMGWVEILGTRSGVLVGDAVGDAVGEDCCDGWSCGRRGERRDMLRMGCRLLRLEVSRCFGYFFTGVSGFLGMD